MKDTRDDLIPGAPADSLVGLGGCDGFVGQVERGMCSTAPPPPPKPAAELERNQASYPPVPIPNLPPMPLRARLLRPWIAGAGGALLIALAAWASGDDAQGDTAPHAAAGSEVRGAEGFGAMVQAHAAHAVAQAKVQASVAQTAAKAAADERAEHDLADAEQGESEDAGETASASSKRAKPVKKTAKKAFSRDAARSAVFGAANRASGCRTKGGPKGRGRATVTIAPSGRVTGVSVSGPFAGTKSGRCIASVFRAVRVAPFVGSSVTLGKSFTVR